jgi:hypothetical protein
MIFLRRKNNENIIYIHQNLDLLTIISLLYVLYTFISIDLRGADKTYIFLQNTFWSINKMHSSININKSIKTIFIVAYNR